MHAILPRALSFLPACIRYHSRMSKRTADGEEVKDTVIVTLAEANKQVKAALMKCGWGDEAAAIQADIMVAAETCGNNQGLVKMYQPAMMAPAAGAGEPIVQSETASTAVIDGQQAPGMLALVKAVDLAVAKAKAQGGIATVGVHNTSTSSGQLAYYGKRAAEQGFIVIITANSPEFVAAKAGAQAMFGTNPLCFACPVEGSAPFVFILGGHPPLKLHETSSTLHAPRSALHASPSVITTHHTTHHAPSSSTLHAPCSTLHASPSIIHTPSHHSTF
jgi:hypothetical protein